MRFLQAIRKYGVAGCVRRIPRLLLDDFGLRRMVLNRIYAEEIRYHAPEERELAQIETELAGLGVTIEDYQVDPRAFADFVETWPFPPGYHGGHGSGVWHEKLFEHYNAFALLDLGGFRRDAVYVDVAACTSPWVRVLRDNMDIEAIAIDLDVPDRFESVAYYQQQDATATRFADASVRAASLQCAFELFAGDDDVGLIREFARILEPGGHALINPLYMHTHYCCYASPEYFRKGYAPAGATEYVRVDARGIPSSRKYDAQTLVDRILDRITEAGLEYRLLALRNRAALHPEIYCHFLLLIDKPVRTEPAA